MKHFDNASNGYVILSVNQNKFEQFIDYLNDLDIGYQELVGGYKHRDTGEFVTEQSVIINVSNLFKVARDGWLDDQESILVLTDKDYRNNYKATLVFTNGSTEDLGRLVQVSKHEAANNEDGFTYREDMGYFICKR